MIGLKFRKENEENKTDYTHQGVGFSALEDSLILMPQNPGIFFTYWNLDKRTIINLYKSCGERIHGHLGILSEENEHEEEISFNLRNSEVYSHYLKVDDKNRFRDGKECYAVLYLPKLHLLVRSNTIKTLVDRASNDASVTFSESRKESSLSDLRQPVFV